MLWFWLNVIKDYLFIMTLATDIFQVCSGLPRLFDAGGGAEAVQSSRWATMVKVDVEVTAGSERKVSEYR